MNRKTAQILSLAALTSFSAGAMAFGMNSVKVETNVRTALPAPSVKVEVKNPTATQIRVGNTLNLKSDIVVPTNKASLKGKGCDATVFDRVAKNTSLSAEEWRNLQAHNAVNVYNLGCDPNPEAFENYSDDARDVAGQTAQCTLSKGIEHVAGLDNRVAIGGPCMADVKRARGVTEATTATESRNYRKVATECNIFPKDAVAQ